MKREIVFYKDRFLEFYFKQDGKVQEKLEYVLDLVRFEKRVPARFFKFLTGSEGIYEIRLATTFKNIRILCFFDEGTRIIITNCLVKKTTKTPRKEIRLAEKLKEEYLKEKDGEQSHEESDKL